MNYQKSNNAFYLLLLVFISIWPSSLIADGYPESYISKQLEAAKSKIEIDLDNIDPGKILEVQYVNRPIYIYRRTPKDIESLSQTDNAYLADPHSENLKASIDASYGSSSSEVWTRLILVDQPDIEKLHFRSIKEDVFVVGGWSPQTGCRLSLTDSSNKSTADALLYDPCTGYLFDSAGRILKEGLIKRPDSALRKFNAYIPPHRIEGNTLIIGISNLETLPELNADISTAYLCTTPTEKLITAARYNDLANVKLALEEGADANFYKQGQGSPLDAAIIGSSMEIIELLIANGARPTPNSLNAASFVNRTEVAELIKSIQE